MDDTINLSAFPDNDGAIVEAQGKKFAIFKDHGKIKVFSPKCTHMQCEIEWQKDEKKWKCPCHGAQFHATGEVLKGPAKNSLHKAELPKDTDTLVIKRFTKRSLDDLEL